MNTKDWLNKVRENKDLLINFVGAYYPSKYAKPEKLPITAENAEKACEVIRKEIVGKTYENPISTFERAIQKDDVNTIYSYLNSAWFGVPESTSCWRIPGFKEAVSLLEDPVEYDYE